MQATPTRCRLRSGCLLQPQVTTPSCHPSSHRMAVQELTLCKALGRKRRHAGQQADHRPPDQLVLAVFEAQHRLHHLPAAVCVRQACSCPVRHCLDIHGMQKALPAAAQQPTYSEPAGTLRCGRAAVPAPEGCRGCTPRWAGQQSGGPCTKNSMPAPQTTPSPSKEQRLPAQSLAPDGWHKACCSRQAGGRCALAHLLRPRIVCSNRQ